MLDEYLRRHDGVITRAQAFSTGLSQDSINRRLRSGHWRKCSRGVYFVDDRPFTDAARVRAAVWAFGAHGTASGLAAAWWQGLTKFAPDVVEVTVPKATNHPKRDGIRMRRRDLRPADIVERNGLRVTALPLTVVEAAVRQRGGAKLMDAALQRHVELPTYGARTCATRAGTVRPPHAGCCRPHRTGPVPKPSGYWSSC